MEFNNTSDYKYGHDKPSGGKNDYSISLENAAQVEKCSGAVNPVINSNAIVDLESMTSEFDNGIRIRVKSDKKETISLHLYNEQGKLVRYKEVVGQVGINSIQLENTAQLSSGAYFFQMTREGEKVTRKIIKQ